MTQGNIGKMQKGFINLNGYLFYLGTDGRMRTGWQKMTETGITFGNQEVQQLDGQRLMDLPTSLSPQEVELVKCALAG